MPKPTEQEQSDPAPKTTEDLKKILFGSVRETKNESPTKVTVVGVGQVGMACSISLLLKQLVTDLVLIDVAEEKVRGEVMDLQHGSLFLQNIKIHGSHEYAVSAGSHIVIITAGVRQKIGESRLSLVQRNVNIYKKIVPQIAKYSPEAVLICISNPVDIMTYVTWKLSGLPRHRVIGSGTNLDSARFRYLIANELGVSPVNVHAYIIGEHGDSSVPLWSAVNVCARNLRSIAPNIGLPDGPPGWDQIHKQVIDGAYDVIQLKGYTNWAIGLSCAEIVASILHNKHQIHPVTCFVEGECGILHDVCLSLPCVLNRGGIQNMVHIDVTKAESKLLKQSAETIHQVQRDLKW